MYPVSILARAEARALHRFRYQHQVARCVSILARAEARALPVAKKLVPITLVFQSSPAPRRGRYGGITNPLHMGYEFQSSPAPRRGRYSNHRKIGHHAQMFQSSPAPRRGRYLDHLSPLFDAHLFQSSPAPRRGRYGHCVLIRQVVTSFNPRPRRGAGATWGCSVRSGL